MRRISWPLVVGCVLAVGFVRSQTPTFRGGAEVIAVDVQVVDHDGDPIADLAADKFTVTIDGRRRRVISATLIDSSASSASELVASRNTNTGAAPLARVVI